MPRTDSVKTWFLKNLYGIILKKCSSRGFFLLFSQRKYYKCINNFVNEGLGEWRTEGGNLIVPRKYATKAKKGCRKLSSKVFFSYKTYSKKPNNSTKIYNSTNYWGLLQNYRVFYKTSKKYKSNGYKTTLVFYKTNGVFYNSTGVFYKTTGAFYKITGSSTKLPGLLQNYFGLLQNYWGSLQNYRVFYKTLKKYKSNGYKTTLVFFKTNGVFYNSNGSSTKLKKYKSNGYKTNGVFYKTTGVSYQTTGVFYKKLFH